MQSRGATMSPKLWPHCVMFLVLVLCLSIEHGSAKNGSVSCIEAERLALLSFKSGLRLTDSNTDHPLSSWDDKRDCCDWLGIRCSHRSGHVISLDIGDSRLEGKLNPSLFELRHLTRLSLYYINFSGNQIPTSIGTLSRLRELQLDHTYFGGKIPTELGNLSRLEILILEFNDLHGLIPPNFSKLTTLEALDLSNNQLSGSIPDIFWNMTDLVSLYLWDNMLEGELPRSIWNLTSLEFLRLGSNKLHGRLPESMSRLNLLELFDISENLFQGEITEAHFTNLSMLDILNLSSNSLSLNFHPNWTPPFNLSSISLGSCRLGPRFPIWLQTQTHYFDLNISNTGISDSIPDWFWYLPFEVGVIDLSHNQIRGGIANYNIPLSYPFFIDLSSNKLEGSVPPFFTQFPVVSLYQNRFSKLNFSKVNTKTPLGFLDISNNDLSGELLDCWSYFKSLEYLILSNNNLSGRVPSSFGSLNNIRSLKLYKNKISGEIPWSLQNCRSLRVLDFGENKLSGPIPVWFGTGFSYLTILSLRFNSFSGGIPTSLCGLSNLQVLDLSSNNIIGSIPNCISSFATMTTETSFETPEILLFGPTYYVENLHLVWKGGIKEFKSTLNLVKSIDLSNNKLNGEIPREITELSQLVSLNLSRNNLSGRIPQHIGRMKSLDALDLSKNSLIGLIPQSLAQIHRLNALDLSNNNLSGKIPVGTQLQSFESAYLGNLELCGEPLLKNCSDTRVLLPGADYDDSDESLDRGFYISMVIGFTTSFWGVCGILIFNKSFRYAYFKLVNAVGDWIYVKTTIQCAKVMRMIRG